MGTVSVRARIENLGDALTTASCPPDSVRHVEITEARIEPGSVGLSLPGSLIARLGLKVRSVRTVRTANGSRSVRVFDPVRLTVQDRDCPSDVAELPDGQMPIISPVALLALDLVVDPVGQRLIGNPAHGGEHIIELY